MAKKLILCVCGAGINTSHNAAMTIEEYFGKAGVADEYEIKFLQVDQMAPYKGRKNMGVCWMTQVDESFGAPSVQGLAFLIGGKKAKQELTDKIIALMDEIYEEE